MSDIFQELADTKPVESSIFDTLEATKPVAAFDPEAREIGRKINADFAASDFGTLNSGRPLPARPSFDPSSSVKSLFEYLSDYTQGSLKINPAGLSPEQLDKARARLWLSLKNNRPNAYALYSQSPPAFRKQIDDHLRTAAWLNEAPLTPAEHLRGASLAIQEWQKSAAANLISDDIGTTPASVPPAQALDWYARNHSRTLSEIEAHGTADDKALLKALGGIGAIEFLSKRSQFWARRTRLGLITGQSAFDPNAAPIKFRNVDPAQPVPPGFRVVEGFGKRFLVPDNPDVEISDFMPVSPAATTLVNAGQQIGVAKAQYAADLNTTLERNPLGRIMGAAAAGKVLDLTGARNEQPSWIGATIHNRATSLLWNVGKTALVDVVPPALSVGTFGLFDAAIQTPERAIESASLLLTGDSETFRKNYERATHYFARLSALHGAAAGSKDDADLIQEAEKLDTDFPDLPDEVKHEIKSTLFGMTRATNDFARRLAEGKSPLGTAGRVAAEAVNLDDPQNRILLGDSLGAMVSTPGGAVLAALGLKGASQAGVRAPTAPKTPLDFARPARIIDNLAAKIDAIPDRVAAAQFADRVTRTLKTSLDPITPERAGQISAALDRFTAATQKLEGTALPAEARAALRDLAEPLSTLNPVDAAFALTGEELAAGPATSVKKVDALTRWYDAQSKSIAALDLPRQFDRSPAHMVAIQAGLIKHADRIQQFGQRQARLREISSDLTARTHAELGELRTALDSQIALKTIVDNSFNDFVESLANRTLDLETNGGVRHLPNPALKSAAFRDVCNALQDGSYAALARLTKNKKLTAGTTILEDLASVQGLPGPYGTIDVVKGKTAVLREWARARRREMLEPLTEDVAPLPEPNTAVRDRLLSRLDEARKSGTSIVLDKAELTWLNNSLARPGGDIPPTPGISKIYADEITSLTKRASTKERFLTDLDAFRTQIASATVDKPHFKVDPGLRRALEDALGEEAPLMIGRRHVSLAPSATASELSALDAFKESLSDLSRERQALQANLQHISSMEYAAVSSNPLVLLHEQEWIDRASRGSLEWDRYTAATLAKRLGREVTPAERNQFYHGLKEGRVGTSEALKLMQEHRFGLLRQCLDAGVIAPDTYVNLVGRNYAHNVFDKQTQFELHSAFERRRVRTPAGYGPLRVDPGAMHHVIPENGEAYVAYRDRAGNLATRDGFASADAAEAWIKDNLPAGSEVEIGKTWPLVEKEIAGLVADPAVAHLDLTSQLTLAAHNARISQFIATEADQFGPAARRLSDLEHLAQRGGGTFNDTRTIFTTKDGNAYHLFTDTHNKWLHGRYVSRGALRWLEETQSTFGFAKAFADVVAEEHPMHKGYFSGQSRILDRLVQAVKSAVPVGGNVFSLVNIAASYKTVLKNWMQNLIDSRHMDPTFWHPGEFGSTLRYAAEGLRSRLAGKTLEDPAWQALAKSDLVRFGDEASWFKSPSANHSRIVETEITKAHKSLEALEARRAHLQDELGKALDSAADERALKIEESLLDLDNQIKAANVSAAKSWFRSIAGHAKSAFSDFADAVVHGRGKAHESIWNYYNEVTGDRLVKYIAYRRLTERHGLSPDAALERISLYGQQLHRVGPSVKQIGRTMGGAMYVSFPFDQWRKFINLATREPQLLMGTLFQIAGWNAALISGSGNDLNEYLEFSALRSGVRRNGISDAQALLGGLKIPVGSGGLFSMSLGPGLWDIFTPQSSPSRALSETVLGDNASAGLRFTTNAVLGAASKFMGADQLTMLVNGLVSKSDQRGDPLNNIGDVFKWLARMYLIPKGLPGSHEYAVLSRALGGEEIDLRSGRPVPFMTTLASLTGMVRPEADTPSRFRAAMIAQIRALGRAAEFKRNEAQDDMLSTLIARGATLPDGSVDRDKARPIIEQYFADHPRYHQTPDGLKVLDDYGPDAVKFQLDVAGQPSTIRTFRGLNLATQLSTFALWRSIDRDAVTRDGPWVGRVRDLILKKLSGRTLDLATRRECNERIAEALASERVPPDAIQDLRLFSVLLNRVNPK